MQRPGRRETLDRHALVMTIWLGLCLPAAALLLQGMRPDSLGFTIFGFAVLVAAFIGHIIVNALYDTTFSARELALGLVIYAATLAAVGIGILVSTDASAGNLLVTGIGLLVFGAAVVFYMITHFGMRRVFDAFDIIRDFRGEKR